MKNYRDGTITIASGGGSPVTLTVQYENGDFSLSGVNQSNTEITKYLDRGALGSVRHTSRSFPTGQFSAHLTEISDATNQTLWDAVNKTGAFSAATSTLGANAEVWTLNITLSIEGTTLGEASDHTIVLNDCRCSIDVAEGDPDSFTLSFEVLGSITAT